MSLTVRQPTSYHPCDDIEARKTAARDLAQLFVGEQLSYGMTRWVFPLEMDATSVIKFEPAGDHFQNVVEWRTWHAVKNTPAGKWFAPCVALSPNGLWLIQRRVTFPPRHKYPAKLPSWFNDTKYQNFGMLGRRFVCCDYGVMKFDFGSYRMRKARWWDANGSTGS